jgi:hypothetical protein
LVVAAGATLQAATHQTREVRFLPGQPALQPQRTVVQHANDIPRFAGQ